MVRYIGYEVWSLFWLSSLESSSGMILGFSVSSFGSSFRLGDQSSGAVLSSSSSTNASSSFISLSALEKTKQNPKTKRRNLNKCIFLLL